MIRKYHALINYYSLIILDVLLIRDLKIEEHILAVNGG